MRLAPLALLLLATTACRRGALDPDAGGGGVLRFDAAVADASGEAMGGTGGTTPSDGATATDVAPPTADANCGATTLAGRLPPARILVLVDEAVTDPTGWTDLTNAVVSLVFRDADHIEWGLDTFPGAGPACGAGAVPAGVDVPIASTSATAVAAGLGAAPAARAGSATAAAVNAGAAYLRTLPTDEAKYMLLLTDHAPSCAGGTSESLTMDPTQAQGDAIAALRAAAGAPDPIPTLVAAPSTARDVAALNALAEAGGRPRATGGIEFNTESTLADQFMTVTPDVSCVFPLSARPPVPDNVTVTFNGMEIARDTEHLSGWDYVASNAIEIYGYSCEVLLMARSYDITVLYGCP